MARKIKKHTKSGKGKSYSLSTGPIVDQAQFHKPKNKIKLLAYCDSPTVSTGFGTVSRNILLPLHKTGRYDITVCGINYHGDPHSAPFPIYPMITNPDGDPFGRKKIQELILTSPFPHFQPDVFFFFQDSFILSFLPNLAQELKARGKYKPIVTYFPIDGKPKPEWVKGVLSADVPVVYTKYGYDMCTEVVPESKDKLSIIPHGVNFNDFYPIPKNDPDLVAFINEYFGQHLQDAYIIMNLNRNQQRKDIPRTILMFRELLKDMPDAVLYLHCAMRDVGWALDEVINGIDPVLQNKVIFPAPQIFNTNRGFDVSVVNKLYNIADVCVSTTLGEGWGNMSVEAMATKTPVVIPNNTTAPEILGSDRGWLVRSGGDLNLHTVVLSDNEVVRPLTDIKDMIEKLKYIRSHPEEATRRAENGYKWLQENLRWEKHIVPQWDKIFTTVVENFKNKASVDTGSSKIEVELV